MTDDKLRLIDECLALIARLRPHYPDANLHYAERLHLDRADRELRELRAAIVERASR